MNQHGDLVYARNQYGYLGSTVAGDELDSRFTGHRYDLDTKLIITAHRMFDPESARWTQLDSLSFMDGFNRYVYVGGDFVNFVDPLGQYAFPADKVGT